MKEGRMDPSEVRFFSGSSHPQLAGRNRALFRGASGRD